MIGWQEVRNRVNIRDSANRYPYPCILLSNVPLYNVGKTLNCAHAQQHILNTGCQVYIRGFDEKQLSEFDQLVLKLILFYLNHFSQKINITYFIFSSNLEFFHQLKHEIESILRKTDCVQQMHQLDYNQQQKIAF